MGRFDQKERPPRPSADRPRSRSPTRDRDRDRDTYTRSRSPLPRDTASGSPDSAVPRRDAKAAAAEAAARINATLNARKAIQTVDVPPIRASSSSAMSPPARDSTSSIGGEIYTQDGDYIQDIEINDLRNRYTLTKSATQKMIKEETGADVTTRGEYVPNKSMISPSNPPLHLHITSTSKEGLEKAVQKINDMIQQDLPNLVDERRFRRREQPPQHELDEHGRRKWPDTRVPIDLEPIQGFNLRAQVVGQGGQNVKWIQQETRTKIQIKGRGSGFIEPITNLESDEPMYLHIAGPQAEWVEQAKKMAEELLETVKQAYNTHKERGPTRNMGRGPSSGYEHGNRDDNRNHANYNYNNNYSASGGGYGAQGGYGSSQATPTDANGPSGPGSTAEQNMQWALWYARAQIESSGAQQSPEEIVQMYGGAEQYLQAYQQWVATAYSGYGADASAASASANDGGAAPPPPPPADEQPPPPPPGPPGLNAVPPPPGM